MKRLFIVVMCTLFLSLCLNVSAPAAETPEITGSDIVSGQSAKNDVVRADEVKTVYREKYGRLQYRRWNSTRGYWIDPDWIFVSAVVPVNFNTSTTQNYGKFTASKSHIYITFGRCTANWGHIKIHSDSYSGSVVGSFIMPYGNSAIQTVPIDVTVGSTYYITVEPYADYIQAIGSFSIDY